MGTNGGRLFMDVPFNQTGLTEILSGELILRSTTHTLGVNSTLGGAGTLRLQSPVTLLAAVNFVTLNVFFESGASVSGAFTLSNEAGGTITVNQTMSLASSMTIAGTLTVSSASQTLTINGTLTLNSSGVLNNPGTVRVGQFVSNGGTINGNPPVLLAPSPAPLRIEQIGLADTTGETVGPGDVGAAGSSQMVVLKWRAAPGGRFVVQSSNDLRNWADLPAVILESSAGVFQATLQAEGARVRFYRLRRL
jgi:hypothetical protein